MLRKYNTTTTTKKSISPEPSPPNSVLPPHSKHVDAIHVCWSLLLHRVFFMKENLIASRFGFILLIWNPVPASEKKKKKKMILLWELWGFSAASWWINWGYYLIINKILFCSSLIYLRRGVGGRGDYLIPKIITFFSFFLF